MKAIFKTFSLLVFMTTTSSVLAFAETPEVKTACEYYDDAVVNVLDLESASFDAKAKIERVEEVIDDESVVRSTILSSIKDLFGLKQTDKEVFTQMKKEIATAREYYDEVDVKVDQTTKILDETYCEDLKLSKAMKVASDTQGYVEDEAEFRKQFAASLKEKLKVIQEQVRNAKK